MNTLMKLSILAVLSTVAVWAGDNCSGCNQTPGCAPCHNPNEFWFRDACVNCDTVAEIKAGKRKYIPAAAKSDGLNDRGHSFQVLIHQPNAGLYKMVYSMIHTPQVITNARICNGETVTVVKTRK